MHVGNFHNLEDSLDQDNKKHFIFDLFAMSQENIPESFYKAAAGE